MFFQIKMSERLKLRRKRIGGGASNSASYQPTNRVNKFLSQAIEARSVDREKANHVNLFSLCFRDSEKERQVSFFLGLQQLTQCYNVKLEYNSGQYDKLTITILALYFALPKFLV